VPRVLADEHAEASEAGVEGPYLGAGLHEPRLVEDPVGGEEELAVHVTHREAPSGRVEVGHTVVDAPPPPLVEAHRDVRCVLGSRSERVGHFLGRAGRLHDPALQEIAREARLGKKDHVGPLRRGLHHVSHALQISGHVAFARFDLGDGHPQRRSGLSSVHRVQGVRSILEAPRAPRTYVDKIPRQARNASRRLGVRGPEIQHDPEGPE
jgi:hypothetical protein